MPKSIQYQVILGNDFRKVQAALRHVNRELPSKFRQKLIEAAKPAVKDAQARARAIQPTQGAGHTGMRGRVARGVRTVASPAADVPYIRIITSMPESDEAVIPRGLDRQEGWRHPVFGNMDVWVDQHTGGSWFREAIADHQEEFQRGQVEALEWAAEFVDEAGD